MNALFDDVNDTKDLDFLDVSDYTEKLQEAMEYAMDFDDELTTKEL